MTLRTAHEVGFAAAMVCGLLGLLLGGELPAAAWLVFLTVPVSAWQSLHDRALSTSWGGAVGLAFFALTGMLYASGGDGAALHAASLLLLGMLAARLLTRTYPSHDLQALVLSLLLMFAGTLLHQAFTYALVLVAYTVAATWALLTRQLISGCTEAYFRHGNRATWAASLARTDVVTVRFGITVAALAWCILLSTGVLFVVFPRVGLGGMTSNAGNTLLADAVSLSGMPRAQGSSQVMVRLRGVTRDAADVGLYLRGRVYDQLHIDGFGNTQGSLHVRPSHLAQVIVGAPITYELDLQNAEGEHLLALGPVLSAHRSSGGSAYGAATALDVALMAPTSELVALEPMQGPMRLTLEGYNIPLRAAQSGVLGNDNQAPAFQEALEPLEPGFAAHFLQLPQNLDPNVVALARSIVHNTPRFSDRALLLRRFLLQNFSYTLAQPNAQKPDPLASFLFDDRRGHCEFFAVAYAVMLRAVGVPSRVVGGYQGGTWDEAEATVLFSGRNAHAWVEWYLPARGWVTDDATPPSDVAPLSAYGQWLERAHTLWDESVMQFGLADQAALLKGLSGSLGGAFAPLSNMQRVVTGQATSWPQVASGGGVACLMVGAAALGVRRVARKRRGPALGRALLRALERLGRAQIPAHQGYAEALAQLRAQGRIATPEADALLQEAVQAYCRYRYGPPGPIPRTFGLSRQLARLRPES